MSCLGESDLLELFERSMSVARRAEVDDHIDTCASCRELVAKMARASGPQSERTTIHEAHPAWGSRFELEARIDVGAMGEVYQARDAVTGELVAVKVMRAGAEYDDARFDREARILAELSHPCIVRYIAHGVTADHERYIAMEWLDGESLAARIKRAPLTIGDSVRVARRVAEGLGAAHARGIIHRDVKPGNVVLVGGDPDHTKLIDFGVARSKDASVHTTPGAVLGTAAYMAPEQARALAIDARADIFSLGCLLFRCLTGTPAYRGDNIIAILAKVVLEEAPRVRDRAKVPAALDELVASMMARDPHRRPPDAASVIARLDAIERSGEDLAGVSSIVPVVEVASLTGREQRVVSLVAVSAYAGPLDHEMWQRLADGTYIAVMAADTAAKDRAARAVRAALALRRESGDLAIAVATGNAFVDEHVAFGAVIDRVSELLLHVDHGGDREGVLVDSATAGLLDATFDVTRTASGARVRAEHLDGEPLRGLATSLPFVGRERELETLDRVLEACVEEPAPRCVVITGREGFGKSRLLAEWLASVRARDVSVSVWIGRGDAATPGASALVGQMLRRAAGIQLGEPAADARTKLVARVSSGQRGAELLGGLAGVEFPSLGPQTGDQALAAWLDFVEAELRRGPLVIALEDLHWGDTASVQLCDAALRVFHDLPLMVVALGRPELREVFPKLFEDRNAHGLALGPLGKRACEALARGALAGASAADTTRIAAQAQGSALMLEELVRAHMDGRGAEVPESVLAIVGTRLALLPETTRLVLRAASVFGASFWRGAVRAMIGGSMSSAELSSCLDTLVEKDVVVRRVESRFAHETEYAFRHALMRDAAYRMFVEEDLVLAHRMAARWLVGLGERDAATIAAHYDAALERPEALAWHRRASDDAYDAGDVDAASAQAGMAIACGARGEVLGVLHLALARVSHTRGALAEQRSRAEHALAMVAPGSAPFYEALGLFSLSCERGGDPDAVRDAAARLLDVSPTSARADVARGHAGARVFQALRGIGADGAPMLEVVRLTHERHPRERALAARLHEANATAAKFRGDIARYLDEMRAALAIRTELGDAKQLVSTHADIGDAWAQLGRWDEALAESHDAVARADRLGMRFMARATRMNVGCFLARQGRLEEARPVLEQIVLEATRANERHFAHARAYLADVLRRQGHLDEADRTARAALDLGVRDAPFTHITTLIVLAEILMARGAVTDALATSAAALDLVREHGVEEGEMRLRVVHAEALHASGDSNGARAQIEEARRLVLDTAERLPSGPLRESFLENVAENAAALARARQWYIP